MATYRINGEQELLSLVDTREAWALLDPLCVEEDW